MVQKQFELKLFKIPLKTWLF